jgi:hypothetical protein
MPTVSPNSPADFTPFNSEEEHVRAHRALETAVESIETVAITTINVTSLTAGSATFTTTTTFSLFASNAIVNTNSVVSLVVAGQIGLGGQTPGTSSTAAPVKGIYRTAATVGVGIPSMSTSSITATIVSVESQMGNPVQPGVPIIASPQAALPAGVYMGQAYCLDTNSITFSFFSRSGINATATVVFHVFSVDTIP